MRFAGIFLLVWQAAAQIHLPTGQTTVRGPAPARPVARQQTFYRGGYGYWGSGYANWPQPRMEAPVAVPEPKAPILASSSLYQPDRAQPVMREYGDLPATTLTAPKPAGTMSLIAFRDGRIEAVQVYWTEGENLGYVTAGDGVRKAALKTVDVERSEKLNRQKGVEFRLQPAR